MPTQIYVNLPVKDLQRSIDFFTRLGYRFEPKFTNEQAACMVVGESIYVMLLVESYFQTFIDKPVTDPKLAASAIVAVSADSRAQVDALVDQALAAGARAPMEPKDYGFMYYRAYEDLDGHNWEVLWMDPSAEPPMEG